MATVVLVRHGRSTSNSGGTLAGRLPGVRLDDSGREQVRVLAERLRDVTFARAVSSPLERCRTTAEAALSLNQSPPLLVLDEQLLECDYGTWSGRTIKELLDEPLWGTVQAQPSAAQFPGGEAMVEMSARMIRAVRAHDAAVEAEFGPSAVWLLVSHGDPLKAVLADALGMHLDLFQRLVVDPASTSIVRYTQQRPYVLSLNAGHGDLGWLSTSGTGHGATTDSGDAVPGGGSGTAAAVASDGA